MPLTPEDIRTKEFRNSIRGYNEHEVDAFLDEVEAELTRLLRDNSELRERATTAAASALAAPLTAVPAPMGETEEMLRRTLLIAQRTADETVAQAKAEADRIVAEAQAHTQQLVNHAQQQASTHVADLDNRRKALEVHIEGLRAFEREYRTRLKAYLEAQLRDLDGRAGATAAVAPVEALPAAAQPPAPYLSATQPIATQPVATQPIVTPPTPVQSTAPPAPPAPPAITQAPAPVMSAPPAIPIVEEETFAPTGAPMTDIPGGFVRRRHAAPEQDDVPPAE
ncbi:MAG: DivIVA domain-containing protein [Actinomycetota bacterium]